MSAYDHQELYQLRVTKDEIAGVVQRAKGEAESLSVGNEGRKAIDRIVADLQRVTEWEAGRSAHQRHTNGYGSTVIG